MISPSNCLGQKHKNYSVSSLVPPTSLPIHYSGLSVGLQNIFQLNHFYSLYSEHFTTSHHYFSLELLQWAPNWFPFLPNLLSPQSNRAAKVSLLRSKTGQDTLLLNTIENHLIKIRIFHTGAKGRIPIPTQQQSYELWSTRAVQYRKYVLREEIPQSKSRGWKDGANSGITFLSLSLMFLMPDAPPPSHHLIM